jgi:hypothetical protein
MQYSDGHPRNLRWADPDQAETPGQRELIIAIGNLTEQVMRLADATEDQEVRQGSA